MTTSETPQRGIVDKVVRRILQVSKPKRVILFGSAGRGDMGPDSDLDILVIVPDGTHRRRTAQTIYRNLSGLGLAKDIVVVTESDVRDYGANPSLVLLQALREGKEIYHVTA